MNDEVEAVIGQRALGDHESPAAPAPAYTFEVPAQIIS